MNSLILYHLLSGHAFFSGTMLIVIAAGISLFPKRKSLAITFCLIGMILIAISGTPFSLPMYLIAVIAITTWLGGMRSKKWNRYFAIGLISLLVGMAIYELGYQFSPKLQPVSKRSIAIIGDSVTAGLDDGTITWPNLMSKENQLEIEDYSHVGETAASADKRIEDQRIESPVLIIEIGGNDLLGSTSAEKFENDLRKLLERVCDSDRQVVMFELPLPPFRNAYGAIQRRLANEFHVRLIPKRKFLSILLPEESTLDSIHLSQTGQKRMAEVVWGVIQSAFVGSK